MPYKEGKKWRAVVKIGGKRAATKLFDKKGQAKTWEEETRSHLLKTLTAMDVLTLSNDYLDMARVKFVVKVYQEKKSVINRFLKHLGENCLVVEITPKQVNDFLLKQAQTRSANAANKDRKNLKAMFSWAGKILDLERNPASRTETFPHDREPQYTPSEDDVLKVLSATSGQSRVFLEAFLSTAARRGEVFRMKWEDVNFEKGEIRLWTRKTKDGSLEGEWMPMNDRLHDALFWWRQHRVFKDSLYVFVDDQPGPHYGKPYNARRRFLPGLCDRVGVRPFGFHALRRFVASMLADKHRQSSKTVQRVLRHKNVRTTELYLQNLNKDIRSVFELLDDGTRAVHEDTTDVVGEDGESGK